MGPRHLVEFSSPRLSCGRDILARMESALGCRGSFATVNVDDDDCAKATASSCSRRQVQGFPTGCP